MTDPVALRAKMYGEDDLSSIPVFGGGFINFGYWRDIPLTGVLTEQDRVRSQLDLYRQVYAGVGAGDRVVEVGSGLGVGATWALGELGPASITGVDLNPAQVERACSRAPQDDRLTFVVGAAGDLPLADSSADVVLSLEAAQHMDDLRGFARSAHRVLRPGGRFVVSTFFVPDPSTVGQVSERLETFASGVDREHPLPLFLEDLAVAGFSEVSAVSIGEHVWPGLDLWIAQLGYAEDTWPRRWLTSYRDGLLDYYVVTATA
ncbi:class I SAM-dependent methyltransferase [Actinokineospora diospyrosa]|uniref:Methyltransferase domain-containing protein n=1 Tax=Actinokineospora diospyrosa TaxID=103728 RepID=A0ABT1I884_9PSEU|nr:class I SAM-dependent methyltransferase [Actinokineospora diospyrosa]MCP2268606.1 Methyltransferase domain-containing protein [Actinokineospora diospyrosa]